MKLQSVLFIVVVASAFAVAQTSSNQAGTSTAKPHSQHHPSASTSSTGQTGAGQSAGAKTDKMSGDMSTHMADMKADMQQMQTHVQQMRADAEKVQDANTRSALMHNVEMWERFLDRMQSHMQMMGQGMMGHGMKGEMMGKPDTSTTPPPKTPQ